MAIKSQFLKELAAGKLPSGDPVPNDADQDRTALPQNYAEAVRYFEARDLRIELEERSAILQFDGGLSRDTAERQAIEEILTRYDLKGPDHE